MSNLYNVVSTSTPDHLLNDPQGADVIAVPMTPGKGVVPRGTVIFREANGMWSPAAAANVVETNELAVLNEDVNTSADASIAEDAAAYRAGRFAAGRVTLTAGAALTAAHVVILRKQGIVLNAIATAAEFDNKVSG